MTYDPSQIEVGERILQDLETTIKAISTPDYAFKMKHVGRYKGTILQNIPEFPACVIVPLEETVVEKINPLHEHTLPVALILGYRGADWREKVRQLALDVQVAVLSDYTRGNLAMDTRWKGLTPIESDPTKSFGGIQANIEIVYRTLYHEPTTPH